MNIYERALEKWGIVTQLDILQEECAELIKAASKIKRAIKDEAPLQERAAKKQLIEEMADVEIMIEQMKVCFPGQDFYEVKGKKLDRLDVFIRGDD